MAKNSKIYLTKPKLKNFSFQYPNKCGKIVNRKNLFLSFLTQDGKYIKTPKSAFCKKVEKKSIEPSKQRHSIIQTVSERVINFFKFLYRFFTDINFAYLKLRAAGSLFLYIITFFRNENKCRENRKNRKFINFLY